MVTVIWSTRISTVGDICLFTQAWVTSTVKAGPGCSASWIVELIQEITVSTRAVVSTWECGQPGPVLSTDTSCATPSAGSVKYGAPESYRQALVSGCGWYAVTPMFALSSVVTVTCPVCRWV